MNVLDINRLVVQLSSFRCDMNPKPRRNPRKKSSSLQLQNFENAQAFKDKIAFQSNLAYYQPVNFNVNL